MPFKNLLSYWNSLQKRERCVVGAGMAGLFLLLSGYFALLPLIDAREKMTRSIQRQGKVLQELVSLSEQYRRLKGSPEASRSGMSPGSPDFTMSSRLDRILNEADMKSCVQDFQTTKSSAREGNQLVRTELKISRVKMDQFLKFLHLVESPEYGMRIEQISIVKTPGETEYLNATVSLKTYERKLPG